MASERIQRRIDILLDQADEAVAKSDWGEVRDRAQNVLRLDPGNKDALSYLAAAERDLPPQFTQPAAENILQQPPLAATGPEAETHRSRARLEQYIPKELLAKLEGTRAQDATLGERRVVTMLFCDVTGSTAAAERLDPEEWAEIMNGAFQYLITPIYRYEGTLARLMGDAILGFFGAPIAHEDDSQRAVLAGLDIVQGIRAYQEEVKSKWNLDFGVRVGINTGLVVVGEVGSDLRVEYTAMGDAINLAARMEQTAQPGTVQISADTYNLIAHLFECESLGEIGVKGRSEPVPAYRVIGPRAVPSRLRGIEGLSTPLVGRDKEISVLRQALANLHQGSGGIVCLIGEAGIGKTRLIDELHAEWERIAGSEAPWIVGRGVSYDTTRPYGLFLQRVLQMFGVEDNDSLQLVREKVSRTPEAFPPQVHALVVRALEALLAFGTDAGSPQLQGEALQHEVYEAWYDMWRAAASSAPTVIVTDDLHWADPASVELMIDMFSLVDEVPLLLLCSFRPERQSPAWRVKQTAETDYPHRYTEISLSALSDDDCDVLIGYLLNISDSPPQLRQMILAKTEGNPLFVEEFMRSLIDTGAITREEGGLQWHADSKIEDIPIPENLQALLTARIDRLEDDARRTLQLSSVIGRSFHHGVLKLISDPRIALDRQLSTLQRAELIREAGRVPELEYIFQHDLTREAAYNSIRLRERREFHRRVGEAVEEMFDDRLEEQSHLMAHHFFQAGDTQRALKYSVMAGERALSTYANEEALAHFERALAVKNISLTAAEPASDPETAALLFGLGRAQAATLPRHQIQEAVTSLTRALDYYAEAGESDRAVAVAEYPIYPLIGQRIGNDQLIARALALVAPDSPSAGRLLSRYGRLMGIEEGDYHGAQDAFDRALAIARWEEDPILEMRTLADAANVDLIHMRFQDSLEKSMRAIELAGRTHDPHAQVLARYTAVLDNLQLGHLEVARLQASDVLAPAEGLRDRFWHCMALRANQDAAQMAGHFDAARDLSARALAASPTEPRGLCARTVLEYEIGNFAQGAAFLDRLVEVMRLTPPGPAMENGLTAIAIAIIARISGTADRLDLAQAAAESVLSSTAATPFVTGTAGLGMALLSVERGDIPTATEQYTALKPWRGIFWLFINVAVDRVLGLLAHTLGNLDQASAHFEDALAFCRKAGYRPELAWTCCDYADTLLQRNDPGDRGKALSLLDESLAISTELGMRPLVERVLSRREILQA